PEIAAQAAQVRSSEKQHEAAIWRLAPQLSATGSAFGSDQVYPTGKNYALRVSVDATWVLFDGGYTYAKRRQVRAALGGAGAALAGTRVDIAREVDDAARDVEVAGERVHLAGQQHKLAEDAAATARRSFEAGVASALDVRDANDRLYQTDIALADAR